MDWRRADPVAEIDGCIHRYREDLKAQVAMECDAIAARERALAAVDSANAIIRRCRECETTDKQEIDRLLDERQALVPKAREAADG